MKKMLPLVLLLLMLSGCDKKPQEATEKSARPGLVHFAAILVLDDLITNGIESDFLPFSPVPIVDPDDTVTADAIVEDFRQDFTDAQNRYPLKLAEGLSITWNLDHHADSQYGMSFHKEDRGKNRVFAGKLSLRLDPEYYSAALYPTYSKDSDVTLICREFSGATERKNDYLLWVEVTFDKCMAATDYYASVRSQLENHQAQLKERLNGIYTGKEEISKEIAPKLVTYYLAGNAFAEDSVCLTGTRKACLTNLKTEIIRKHENAKPDATDEIRIRVKKGTKKKTPEKKPEEAPKPAADDQQADDRPAATEKPADGPAAAAAPEPAKTDSAATVRDKPAAKPAP